MYSSYWLHNWKKKSQIHDVQKIDEAMPVYNLITKSDTYLKTSARSWQCYGNEPALDNNDNIIGFYADSNNISSFKFMQQKIGQIINSGTKDAEKWFH